MGRSREDIHRWEADNRANWDDRVPIHLDSEMYEVERFVEDPQHVSPIVRFDAPRLGDITGLRVAHLQCHIGTDTISLARLGAEVTGLDFSNQAVAAARELAERGGSPATFIAANVADAAEALDGPFDLVYTGVGALNWLADLGPWAEAVAGLLDPGGRFYVRDSHPALWVYREMDGKVEAYWPYRTPADHPWSWDEAATYTDGDHDSIRHTRTHEWNHPLPEVINALVDAGMRIDRLEEHERIEWQAFPSCVAHEDHFLLPFELRDKVPAMFSLWATKG